MTGNRADVWITGIGIISSLGEGVEQHWQRLTVHTPMPTVDEVQHAPYIVHPLAPIEFSRQIRKTSDQRQMERWQRIGVYAAGLALADANLFSDPCMLQRIDVVVAAGNGERDLALDNRILQEGVKLVADQHHLNSQLVTGLRPTLYLGQLSNLLAGNVSIVHAASGSSRTFKGEEAAGVAALDDAVRRIAAGQSEVALVGAALNAERDDLLLNLELGGALLRAPFRSAWQRTEGGMTPGSVGVFLVIEASHHARTRGIRPYASISTVVADSSRPASGNRPACLQQLVHSCLPLVDRRCVLGFLSGASGVQSATDDERDFIRSLQGQHCDCAVRAYGTLLGHGMEAHFLTGIALGAIALFKQGFYPSFDSSTFERQQAAACRQVMVSSIGHWRGEALGLIEAIPKGVA